MVKPETKHLYKKGLLLEQMSYSDLQYLIQKKTWRLVNDPRVWFDQSETELHIVHTNVNKQTNPLY